MTPSNEDLIALLASANAAPPSAAPISTLSTRSRSLADLAAQEPLPREWLVEGLIPMRTVTFISGDGGVGKSLLGQQLTMAAALGASWCGKAVRQVSSVALYCEDDDSEVHRRSMNIARHLGVPLGDPRIDEAHFNCEIERDNTMMISAWSGARHDGYRVTKVYRELREWARATQARLVLIDSLHNVFSGNENFRPEARAFVQALGNIARAIDGAVVVLAHPSQTGLDRGSGTSGSTAWNNAVRSRLYFTIPEPEVGMPQEGDRRLLTTVKANYGRTGGAIALRHRQDVFIVEEREKKHAPAWVRRRYGRAGSRRAS